MPNTLERPPQVPPASSATAHNRASASRDGELLSRHVTAVSLWRFSFGPLSPPLASIAIVVLAGGLFWSVALVFNSSRRAEQSLIDDSVPNISPGPAHFGGGTLPTRATQLADDVREHLVPVSGEVKESLREYSSPLLEVINRDCKVVANPDAGAWRRFRHASKADAARNEYVLIVTLREPEKTECAVLLIDTTGSYIEKTVTRAMLRAMANWIDDGVELVGKKAPSVASK